MEFLFLLVFIALAFYFLPHQSKRAMAKAEARREAARAPAREPAADLPDDEHVAVSQLDLLTRYGVSEDAERLAAMGVDLEALGYRGGDER